MPTRIEEETLRLAQGSTEQEVIIRDPGYPDPLGQGVDHDAPRSADAADAGRLARSLPRWQRTSIGIDHQIRQGWRVDFDTFYQHTGNDFRSLDLNAPVERRAARTREFGRMLLVQSIGRSRRDAGINVDLFLHAAPRACSATCATATRARMNDADDALTPPPLGTFDTEWAPTRGESRHRFNWNIGGQIVLGPHRVDEWPRAVRHAVQRHDGPRRQRRRPLQRSPGRCRRATAGAARSPRRPTCACRGRSSAVRSTRRCTFNAQRGPGGGGGPGGPRRPRRRAARSADSSRNGALEMYLFVQNLFNRVNYSSYVGVLTSTSSGARRRRRRRGASSWAGDSRSNAQ